MGYDPIEYWSSRQNPNNADIRDTYKHLKFVHRHLKGCEHILDYGPGLGRMFPAYEEIPEVDGFDISEIYKPHIIELSKSYPFKYRHTVSNTPFNTPYPDKAFDAVVCVSVLMHQPDQGLLDLMKELARVGEKVIVVAWHDQDRNIKGNEICFNHDYLTICLENGLEVLYCEYGTVKQGEFEQIYFVYKE